MGNERELAMSDIQIVTVYGEDAIDELNKLLDEFPQTGLFPVLLGDEDDVGMIQEGLEEADAVADLLEDSQTIDALAWFAAARETDPDSFNDDIGEWPDEIETEMGLITHLDVMSGAPKEEVQIGLLKVQHSWEAFAHLGWGGWNDCPAPEEHCAIHRYWFEKYGAEVISITGDVVQCFVANPPKTREAAIELAREQYAYCRDIVEQGTETLAALAAGLLNSEYWYFWWD